MATRIVVGMSGGVDSSVTAALLKEEGFDVIGVHLQMVHDVPDVVASGCSSSQDRQDAIRAAAHLGIPIEIVDAAPVYEREVLRPFLKKYERGVTPNPDVWCNEKVKFPMLLKAADRLGAAFVATGHYARTDGEGGLLRGKDANKDQSYFLARLDADTLKRTKFPLGEITKDEVRKRAEKLALPVATKQDSVGLCFVGDIDMSAFLREKIDATSGPILNENGGDTLGEHDGLPFFTVGQRRGLEELGGSGPWYVVGKDLEKNALLVSNVHDDPTLFRAEAILENMHWIDGNVAEGSGMTAQIRYRQDPVAVSLEKSHNQGEWSARFEKEQRAVTPGQEFVVYQGDKALGSGTIS